MEEEGCRWEQTYHVLVKDLIPKISFYTWLVFQNRILMFENMKKIGFSLPNRCALCKHIDKFVDHLFIHCEFTQEVYKYLFDLFQEDWVSSHNLWNIWLQWESPFKSQKLHNLWEINLHHILWIVWKEINHQNFKYIRIQESKLAYQIFNFIKENFDVIKFKEIWEMK